MGEKRVDDAPNQTVGVPFTVFGTGGILNGRVY